MKLKSYLLPGIAVAALAGRAGAADLPPLITKGQPVLVPPSALVWFVGIGTEASTQQASVQGNNLFVTSLASGNLQASGGAVTGAVGFLNTNPNRWFRCQATAGYQNITGANAVIGSVASRWEATQECDIGFEWIARITSVFPNLGLNIPLFTPQLPANVLVAGTPKQYVGAGAKEQGLSGQFFGGSGSDWSWAPMVTTGYIWQTLDTAGKPTSGLLDAYVNVSWPQHGVTIGGVGGPGAPTFGAGAKLGTQYTVGLRYDFLVSN